MTLAERLHEASRPTAKQCRLGILLGQLSDDDRATLTAALEDRVGYTSALLVRVLRDEGHAVSATTVKLHRVGGCSCGA